MEEEKQAADRELLELAAKAAGFEMAHTGANETVLWLIKPGSVEDCYGERPIFAWNPLTGDGDAIRLAVKCKLMIDTADFGMCTTYWSHGHLQDECHRRSIVRAAAEIGRRMA